jgi:hypothetical protein
MKKTKPIDAATAAHHELLRTMPEQEIQQQLRPALHRARLWYRLHGRRFRLPNDGSTKSKAKR